MLTCLVRSVETAWATLFLRHGLGCQTDSLPCQIDIGDVKFVEGKLSRNDFVLVDAQDGMFKQNA